MYVPYKIYKSRSSYVDIMKTHALSVTLLPAVQVYSTYIYIPHMFHNCTLEYVTADIMYMCTYIYIYIHESPHLHCLSAHLQPLIIDSGVSNKEWNSIYNNAVNHCLQLEYILIITSYTVTYPRYLYIATVYRIADMLHGVCMLTSNLVYIQHVLVYMCIQQWMQALPEECCVCTCVYTG